MRYDPSGSSKVNGLYVIWKSTCDLLVINSNLGHILHRLTTIHPWQTGRQTDDDHANSSTVNYVRSAKTLVIPFCFCFACISVFLHVPTVLNMIHPVYVPRLLNQFLALNIWMSEKFERFVFILSHILIDFRMYSLSFRFHESNSVVIICHLPHCCSFLGIRTSVVRCSIIFCFVLILLG